MQGKDQHLRGLLVCCFGLKVNIPLLGKLTISATPCSSTAIDERSGEPRIEPEPDGTRTGPAHLRRGQAGAISAAQLHSPARARSAGCGGHSAGRLLPTAG